MLRKHGASGGSLLIGALLIGCSGAEGDVEPAKVKDAPQAVSSTPILRVGVEAGDSLHAFHQVRAPFTFPDGRLAVPLGSGNVIRIFASDGVHIESLGRHGEGPGEFAVLTSAWNRGDTIEAADGRLRRVTRFVPDGSVEVVRLRGESPAQTIRPGALSGGWIAGGVAGVQMNGRDVIALHAFSHDGTHLGELARTKGIKRVAAGGGARVHPLSPRAVLRIGGDRIYVGETNSARIRVLDLQGNAEREVTWEVAETLEPEEALHAVQQAPDPLPLYEDVLQEATVPDRVSVFWDFLVDALGFIWVRPYDPIKHAAALGGLGSGDYLTGPGGGGGGRWLILSPDGDVAGSVDVPEGLRPAQITVDRLIAIHVDSLGVESVQVHLLTRN